MFRFHFRLLSFGSSNLFHAHDGYSIVIFRIFYLQNGTLLPRKHIDCWSIIWNVGQWHLRIKFMWTAILQNLFVRRHSLHWLPLLNSMFCIQHYAPIRWTIPNRFRLTFPINSSTYFCQSIDMKSRRIFCWLFKLLVCQTWLYLHSLNNWAA